MTAVSLTAVALAGAVLGCAVLGVVGQVAVARAEADTSADLAALAVAARVVRGESASAACGVGAHVAQDGRTSMTTCLLDGEVVTVEVRRQLTLLGVTAGVAARARAGPVGT